MVSFWRAFLFDSLIIATVGASLWLYFAIPGSPYQPAGGDTVTPETVRAGERFQILRNFAITRAQPMFVKRQMIEVDCRVCAIVDLRSDELVIAPGIYSTLSREHEVPAKTHPGKYRLDFWIEYDDRLNRKVSEQLPPLFITVVP